MARETVYPNRTLPGAINTQYGRTVMARHSTLTGSFAVIAENDYTALATASAIEVVAGAGDTTQFCTIVGLDTLGNRVVEVLGPLTEGTAVAGSQVFDHIEEFSVNEVTSNNVTLRVTGGGATITTITAGQVTNPIAHFFANDDKGPVAAQITAWGAGLATNNANAQLELRVYRERGAVRDLTKVFDLKDQIVTDHSGLGLIEVSEDFGAPIKVQDDSYICIVGKNTAAGIASVRTRLSVDLLADRKTSLKPFVES